MKCMTKQYKMQAGHKMQVGINVGWDYILYLARFRNNFFPKASMQHFKVLYTQTCASLLLYDNNK